MNDSPSDYAGSIERACTGDQSALEDLLRPELPGLLAFVRLRIDRRLRQRESCSDVLQSICREIVEDLPGLREKSPEGFHRWIYAVAVGKILKKSRFHSAGRRDVAREVNWGSEVDERHLVEFHSGRPTPSEIAMAAEELERIEAAFDSLEERQREALLMSRFEGRSLAEIAAHQGHTEAATAQVITRAKAKLARLLTRP